MSRSDRFTRESKAYAKNSGVPLSVAKRIISARRGAALVPVDNYEAEITSSIASAAPTLALCPGVTPEDGDLVTVRLGGNSPAHLLVSGKTGSDKTSLLVDTVTRWDLARPGEMNVVVIDPKTGSRPLADLDSVTTMISASDHDEETFVDLATSALQEAMGVMAQSNERQRVSGEIAPEGSRLVIVVIDHLDLLFEIAPDHRRDQMWRAIMRILREGRSAGVHLVASMTRADESMMIASRHSRVIDLDSDGTGVVHDDDGDVLFRRFAT